MAAALSRDDLGFLLAKPTQRWNELLTERFAAGGHPDVRPSSGPGLLPLYEQDGLRMGELARRARLSKQPMTIMSRRLEPARLIERPSDSRDARAWERANGVRGCVPAGAPGPRRAGNRRASGRNSAPRPRASGERVRRVRSLREAAGASARRPRAAVRLPRDSRGSP